MEFKWIAIDFDGTCVTHEFPNIGKDIGAVPVLRELVEKGCRLILFTMRSGKYLEDASTWFAANEIKLAGLQTNPGQKVWTQSPKAYAELYIDDAGLGCPLKTDSLSERPYVDWGKVREELVRLGYL